MQQGDPDDSDQGFHSGGEPSKKMCGCIAPSPFRGTPMQMHLQRTVLVPVLAGNCITPAITKYPRAQALKSNLHRLHHPFCIMMQLSDAGLCNCIRR